MQLTEILALCYYEENLLKQIGPFEMFAVENGTLVTVISQHGECSAECLIQIKIALIDPRT